MFHLSNAWNHTDSHNFQLKTVLLSFKLLHVFESTETDLILCWATIFIDSYKIRTLEECGTKQRRMANNSEEGQGSDDDDDDDYYYYY
jgi:hypothetical protein